jgi:nuclear pore complex protein Nup160
MVTIGMVSWRRSVSHTPSLLIQPSAALAMYQRARKLAVLSNTNELAQYFALAEQQLEALIVSSNALALLDQKDAWIVLPIAPEGLGARQPERKRRKLTRHIPEDRFASGKRDLEIVKLSDVIAESTLLSAQLDLVRKEPELIRSNGKHGTSYPKYEELILNIAIATLRSPESVVLRLVLNNRFNPAMATARTLEVDMTDLFSHLTRQCLLLSRNPEAVLWVPQILAPIASLTFSRSEDTTDWLLTDKVTSWAGTPSDRGWRYLRQSLERHDRQDTHLRYSKIVFETIIGLERTSTPPPWLIHRLEVRILLLCLLSWKSHRTRSTTKKEHDPEWLIRACMRFELLELALELTLSLIHNVRFSLECSP